MLSIAELGLLNLPIGLERHIKLLGIPKTKNKIQKYKKTHKKKNHPLAPKVDN
jgi:hypothetical protein